MNAFAVLFRKYKLRSEFATHASFGNALAMKGFIYDESIFSHWQKGKRIPGNRGLILAILEIFVERSAITREDDANEFLATTGLGYLTKQELQKLFKTQNYGISSIYNS